jgi:parallel beta-helix repeat protein
LLDVQGRKEKMKRELFSGFLVISLLISMLGLACSIQPVKAEGTIYIRADGSVDPPTAPISTVDNVTYTFTSNIYDSIVIERNNIVLDGAGYILEGPKDSFSQAPGIDLSLSSNVTVKNMEIKKFYYGIELHYSSNVVISGNDILANYDYDIADFYSSNNTVSGNNIGAGGIGLWGCSGNIILSNNITKGVFVQRGGVFLLSSSGNIISSNNVTAYGEGILLSSSSNNTISSNSILANNIGIDLSSSSNNIISRNNITESNWRAIELSQSSNNNVSDNNIAENGWELYATYPQYAAGVYLYSSYDNRIYHNNFINNAVQVRIFVSRYNVWDDGYPSGGNYWSDYTGIDANSDEIGDTPYVIDVNNQDRYPLMNPWTATLPPKFTIGDRVKTTANLNVREGPGLSYIVMGTVPEGAHGQIMAGPVEADGYVWWDVDYDNGVRGWSAENWLTITTTSNLKPFADFTFAPLDPKAGELVTFDASSSYDTDGEILSYAWDWDSDGDNDTYSTSPVAFFWWPENSTYNVSLTIVDDEGAVDTVEKELFIEQSAESRRILAGWGEESQSGATLLASWGQHPIWYMTHKTEHKKLVEIDDFLRDGSQRLSWLPPEFKNLDEPEIVDMLNVQMDQSLAPGLTYLDYVICMVCEAKLVSQAWWQSTPQYYFSAIPLMVKYGMGSVWDALVSEGQIFSLLAKISVLATLVLAVGKVIWTVAAKIGDTRSLVDWTKRQGYCWGLGYYINLRDSWGHTDAYDDPVVQSFLSHSIRDDATEEQRKCILDAWSYCFENFWDNYEGEVYYDAATAHNDKGFPQELETQVKSDIKNLVVYALKANIALRTDKKIVSIASPVELRIYDSQGRITGSLNGEIREEIPYSVYDNETETATIFHPTDSYNYEIIGVGDGTYGLGMTSIESGQIVNFTATDIPTAIAAIHRYTVDWNALSRGEEGVTVQVDSDGDGVFEHTFTSDSELTQSEYVIATDNAPPETQLNIGEPRLVVNGVTYLTSATPIELAAEDELGGSGVASTAYRIHNASYDSGWKRYTQPFLLVGLSDGVYHIDYNSTDYAGNVELTQTIQVTLFSWNYVFTDTYGRGTTLKINTVYKLFQFITPDKDYGIRKATYMQQFGRLITILHRDNQLRLITAAIEVKLDFCMAAAWDLQTNKQYSLVDKPGIEK